MPQTSIYIAFNFKGLLGWNGSKYVTDKVHACKNIFVLINKSHFKTTRQPREFPENVDSTVYVLLEIFVWSSHESKIYEFAGLCRGVYRAIKEPYGFT